MAAILEMELKDSALLGIGVLAMVGYFSSMERGLWGMGILD